MVLPAFLCPLSIVQTKEYCGPRARVLRKPSRMPVLVVFLGPTAHGAQRGIVSL